MKVIFETKEVLPGDIKTRDIQNELFTFVRFMLSLSYFFITNLEVF